MPDDVFDYLCKRLLGKYSEISEHPCANLICESALRAGTCALAVAEYPPFVLRGWHDYLVYAISERTEAELLRLYGAKPKTGLVKRSRKTPSTVSGVIRRTRVK